MFRSRWIQKALSFSRSRTQCRQPLARTRRPVRLGLESLEERVTPDATTCVPGSAALDFFGHHDSPSFTIPCVVKDNLGGFATSGDVSCSLVSGKTVINLGHADVDDHGHANVKCSLGSLPAGLPPGQYKLVEHFKGQGKFEDCDATGTVTINAVSPTLNLTPPSLTLGNGGLTINISTTSDTGVVPSGSVSFQVVNGKTTIDLGKVTLGANGSATLNVTGDALTDLEALKPGTYKLVETFTAAAGSPFANATATGTLTVNGTPITLNITNPVLTLGSPSLDLTVNVTCSTGAIPSGTLTFDVVHGKEVIHLGQGTVDAHGNVTLKVTGDALKDLEALPPGTYQLNLNFTAAPGSPFANVTIPATLTITGTPTTVIVTGPTITVNLPSTLTINVTVNTPSGKATSGNVTLDLIINGQTIPIGTATVGSNGVAIVTLTGTSASTVASLPPGSYTIVVNYTGAPGTSFVPSSGTGTLTITPPFTPAPTVVVTPSPGPAASGSSGSTGSSSNPPPTVPTSGLSPEVAALELMIDLAAIPNLNNPGAMSELNLFSEALLGQPLPTSIPGLVSNIQALLPQTAFLEFPALSAAMWLTTDLAVENPM